MRFLRRFLRRRFLVEWYAGGRWQRIGRTWRTWHGAYRAARRVDRNVVCCVVRITRLRR